MHLPIGYTLGLINFGDICESEIILNKLSRNFNAPELIYNKNRLSMVLKKHQPHSNRFVVRKVS